MTYTDLALNGDFNPRSYKRSDFTIYEWNYDRKRFQSTLLQEERLNPNTEKIDEVIFQSTLLQEERRVSALNTEYKPLISIHAPTRGATLTLCSNLKICLFQSTLLQEERPIFQVFFVLKLIFQSTLLQEERQYPVNFDKLKNLFQSTLLQEERRIKNSVLRLHLYFNPRSYKRSDGANTKAQAETLKFQSTLLQEERLTCFKR